MSPRRSRCPADGQPCALANKSEAEAEYLVAFRAWEEAGRSESADSAGILFRLGSLYVEEQRLDEARRALDRVLVIFSRAQEVVPMDRIKFLNLRGVLHARLGDWRPGEYDLRDALSMADREPSVNPLVLRSILNAYSQVLRKNHQERDARFIEAGAAALPPDRTTAAVVDLTDLLVRAWRAKERLIRRIHNMSGTQK